MISFVIPAYNEASVLAETLRSVHDAGRATERPYEVIVVDDASTDETADIARAMSATVVPVSLRQIAAVRNAGAREASGDIIFFVDADTVIMDDTVLAAIAAIDGGAVGGGAEIHFDGEIPLYLTIALDAVKKLLRLMRVAPGCFLYCTRSAFDATGGFDERLYASEECFMSLALRRQGPFVLLREPVITSGRKLRQYSVWQLVWTMLKLTLSGGLACRRREGLGVWYEGRRETKAPSSDSAGWSDADPHAEAP